MEPPGYTPVSTIVPLGERQLELEERPMVQNHVNQAIFRSSGTPYVLFATILEDKRELILI